MRHPANTRALVLDSVAPNSLFLGNDFALNLEQALDLQFAQCSGDEACVSNVCEQRAQLDALMARLGSEPRRVRHRNATTGEMKEREQRPETVWGTERGDVRRERGS